MKEFFKTELENEDVFLNPTFSEFCLAVVLHSRGANAENIVNYRAIEIDANGKKLKFPCQLFIDGQFIDAENGKTIASINPHDESVICEVRSRRCKCLNCAICDRRRSSLSTPFIRNILAKVIRYCFLTTYTSQHAVYIFADISGAVGKKTLEAYFIFYNVTLIFLQVQCASPGDVDKAVRAAKRAFESGEWSKISARERGQLLFRYISTHLTLQDCDCFLYNFRLADLMYQHREEVATIESIDSGAVYTLALKTHVGMSIETWRYFAGWTDKIQGSTIPISHARPNKNLTFTKREPIG